MVGTKKKWLDVVVPQDGTYAGDVSPKTAWGLLETSPNAHLIDVRTAEELEFVGGVALSSLNKTPLLIPLKHLGQTRKSETFLPALKTHIQDKDAYLLFLCRSGQRSKQAAQLATAEGFSCAYNVLGGFEGKKDSHQQRGHLEGWKYEQLPWQQN